MKRLYIWLEGLDLLQQFMTVGFTFVVVFVVVFYGLIFNNLDAFVNEQMYNYLHRAQSNY